MRQLSELLKDSLNGVDREKQKQAEAVCTQHPIGMCEETDQLTTSRLYHKLRTLPSTHITWPTYSPIRKMACRI